MVAVGKQRPINASKEGKSRETRGRVDRKRGRVDNYCYKPLTRKNYKEHMMKLLRPIFCLTLALITTLLVSCSSPAKAKIPTTYSPEKIAQIQEYREPIVKAREQMNTLEKLIEEENWMDVMTFIHGPLGELRQNMAITSRKLLPKDQKVALSTAKRLFVHLEKLDLAAKERNLEVAKNEFKEALKEFDAYLQIVPSSGS